MQVFYLANEIPWFGAHTGYERLPGYLDEKEIAMRTYIPDGGRAYRAAGKLVSLLRGHGNVSQSDAYGRLRLELAMRQHKEALGHLLYGEEHVRQWRDVAPALLRRSILTLHQPPSNWSQAGARALSAYGNVIVLWEKDRAWFQSRMDGGAVHFIPHGVDTDFFTPGARPIYRDPSLPIRVLYSGVHLRNTAMLVRIMTELNRLRSDLHFDFLVPPQGRAEPALAGLRDHPQVTWHANLTDEQLRELYQQAQVLLLPMNDSGANTAVVEALACGLPMVTTDVGGIRDYGGGDLYPVVKNNDDAGMVALMQEYLAQPVWRDKIAARGRTFAEKTLAWPVIARRHLEVYRGIAP